MCVCSPCGVGWANKTLSLAHLYLGVPAKEGMLGHEGRVCTVRIAAKRSLRWGGGSLTMGEEGGRNGAPRLLAGRMTIFAGSGRGSNRAGSLRCAAAARGTHWAAFCCKNPTKLNGLGEEYHHILRTGYAYCKIKASFE